MAEDIFKPAGATKASKPDAGGGVIRNVPVIGTVKNNIDPTRAGRIQVYISDLGGDDPNNSANWATVSYMTPFYGFVQPTAPTTGPGDYVANPASYGMWYSPPDLESQVICIFINGDPNYGFYIGSIPKPEALHMVPAIGGSENVVTNNSAEAEKYSGASLLPVTNINTNNEQQADSNNFLNLAKPVHSYQASIFFKQGLIRDNIRGPISTSSQRESPSRVGWGVITPGRPIFAGGFDDTSIAPGTQQDNDQNLKIISRRGGHSLIMDDGDLIGRNNLMRLRSAAGHQITMSDDGQTIFIIHSNGQSYIELGKEGTVDIFSTNSFNVRTQGDLNLHADNNINIHAKKKLNIKAEEINVTSEKDTKIRVGNDFLTEVVGKYNLKVAGIVSIKSGDIGSFAASGDMFINGSKVNLNSGSGPDPAEVLELVDKPTTDTLFDASKGYIAAPAQLKTIVTRAPAHTPWVYANQGVSVANNPSVDANIPTAPSSSVNKALSNAASVPPKAALQPAILATVPPVKTPSKSIDSKTAGSLIGATSTMAAAGPAAAAAQTGTGLIPSSKGPLPVLGKLGQTSKQLETGGVIKPGSSVLINSLVQSGKAIPDALPKTLFTGKEGVNELTNFTTSLNSQVNSMITNFQKTQTSLTETGLLTGKETSTVTAGFVMAGASVGVPETIGAIKNSTIGKFAGTGGLTGVGSAVTNAITSGKSASDLAQVTTGGGGSVLNAIAAMGGIATIAKSGNRGITAAAVGAIAASFTPFPSKTAINLKEINKNNTNISEALASTPPNPISQATDLLKLAGRVAGPQAQKVTNAISGGLASIDKLVKARTDNEILGGVTKVVSSIGSIGAATGNKSVQKTANQVNSVIKGTVAINKSIAAIGNAVTLTQQIGSIGQIASTVGTLGRVFGDKKLAANSRKVAQISQNTKNIITATENIINSKNINSTLGAVGSIITNANRIKGTLGNSQKASGIGKIPGGTLSVGSIVNKTLGSLGVPKNPALSAIITNAATSAINKIAFPKAAQSSPKVSIPSIGGVSNAAQAAASNLQNTISAGLKSLQTAGKNITSLSLDNLAPGPAAQLTAATGSIGFGGAGAATLPIIGENTYNATEVSSSIDALLGDSRIPAPEFDIEPDETNLKLLENIVNAANNFSTQLESIVQKQDEVNQLKESYLEAESNLPPGSTEIQQLRQSYIEAQAKIFKLIDDLERQTGREQLGNNLA